MGEQRPARALRVVGRDAHELEVDGAVVVDDEQPVAASRDDVLDVVLDALPAGPDDAELACRVTRVQQPALAGDVGAGLDDQEPAAAGEADADPVLLVGLVEDLRVGFAVRTLPDPVPPHGVRPPGVVHGRVEQVLAARVEERAGARARDLVGECLAVAGQGPHPDRVPLVALGVDGVEQSRTVGADVEAAERVEVVPLGLRVVVQQDLLAREAVLLRVLIQRRRLPVVGAVDGRAAVDAVLLALDGARVVPPVAFAGRDAQVGLPGARLDLVEDLLTQHGELLGARVRVRVLLVQVRDDRWIVLVAEPLVVVDDHVPVVAALGRFLRGVRRGEHPPRLPNDDRRGRGAPPPARRAFVTNVASGAGGFNS